MKWEGNKLMVGGVALCELTHDIPSKLFPERYSEHHGFAGLLASSTTFPTREAAMQAAETAVREWLGKAVAEVMEPVAYGLPNSSITPHHALMQVALDIPSTDQYGGALWVPLYAIAKEPKV